MWDSFNLSVCACSSVYYVPNQRALFVSWSNTFFVRKNNTQSSYVTRWSWNGETWWNSPSGCLLRLFFFSTFYHFPSGIDFLSSPLNLCGQLAGLCFFLLLPVDAISHRVPTIAHTHKDSRAIANTHIDECFLYEHTEDARALEINTSLGGMYQRIYAARQWTGKCCTTLN